MEIVTTAKCLFSIPLCLHVSVEKICSFLCVREKKLEKWVCYYPCCCIVDIINQFHYCLYPLTVSKLNLNFDMVLCLMYTSHNF